jgi:hypothetical protein
MADDLKEVIAPDAPCCETIEIRFVDEVRGAGGSRFEKADHAVRAFFRTVRQAFGKAIGTVILVGAADLVL